MQNWTHAWLCVAVVAALMACSTDDGAKDGSSSGEATSSDGVLSVSFGDEGEAPTDLSIEPVDDVPELFRTQDTRAFVYELGPDGREFDSDVQLTFTFDPEALGLMDQVAPMVLVALEQPDGSYRSADDQVIVRTAKALEVRATTRHFSKAVVHMGALEYRLYPRGFAVEVGQNVDAWIRPRPSQKDYEAFPFEERVTVLPTNVDGKFIRWRTESFLAADNLYSGTQTYDEFLEDAIARGRADIDEFDVYDQTELESGDYSPETIQREVEEMRDDYEEFMRSERAPDTSYLLATVPARIDCLDESDGVVEDAYKAEIYFAEVGENASAITAEYVPVNPIIWSFDEDDPPMVLNGFATTLELFGDAACIGSGGTSGTGGTGTPSGDALVMPNEIPAVFELEGEANVAGGDDSARIQNAVAEVRVRLSATGNGGQITISSTSDEGPSGELEPDGSGGAVWNDNARNDYQNGMTVRDEDVLTDIRIEDDVLKATWKRTNFDGETWTSEIEIPLPSGTGTWFADLPAAGPTDATGDVTGQFDGDTLNVSGNVSLDSGTVVEVWVSGGHRKKVEVDSDGSFALSFSDYAIDPSTGKATVTLVVGAHFLDVIDVKK